MTDLITAADLLEKTLGQGARGYLLAPSEAVWFVKDKACTTVVGSLGPHLVDTAFEIIAFDDDASHHWQRNHGTDHGPCETFTAARWQEAPERHMLLAGHVIRTHDGWAWLQGSAATLFAVPVEAHLGDLVMMTMREITAEDDMGNVRVVKTVLTGLAADADLTRTGGQNG